VDTTWSALLLSLRAASLAVLLLSPAAIAAALLLQGWHGQRRAVADLLLLSPLVLPPTVLGFLLLQLLGPDGPLGSLLQALELSVVFSGGATVVSAAVVAFPLMYRSALASLEQLDPALEAVARGLGCSRLQAFWRVTLPLIRPGLLAGLSLSFGRALGEFGTTMMLAGNIPGRTQTLPLAIYSAVENGSSAEAWRLTTLVLLLNGGCLALVNQLNRRRPYTAAAAEPAAHPDPLPGCGGAAVPIPAAPPRAVGGLQVAIELQRGSFGLSLAWSSQAARLAVLGPSGAGKSLLLRCIAGLERPQRCRIQLGERLLCDSERGIWVAPQHRRIAMVFQQHALFPHLNAAANVAFGLRSLSREQRRSRVAMLLAAVGLQQQARLFPHQLSGGQGQRLALARALAVEPDLLLLDEPLNAQDCFRRRQLQQWIDDLQRCTGTPILLVTHDIEEAERLSDELLVLDGGQLLRQAAAPALRAAPGLLTVAQLIGCPNLSPIERLGPGRCRASAWDLWLEASPPLEVGGGAWIGLWADQLRLGAAGGSAACSELIVRPCRLVQVNQVAGRVSARVQLAAGGGAIQVDLDARDWQQLPQQDAGLELLIPSRAILWLRHGLVAPRQ